MKFFCSNAFSLSRLIPVYPGLTLKRSYPLLCHYAYLDIIILTDIRKAASFFGNYGRKAVFMLMTSCHEN